MGIKFVCIFDTNEILIFFTNCKNVNKMMSFNRAICRVPGMDAMIYCKDGQCKFVNPTELLLNQSEEEILASNQVTMIHISKLTYG